MTHLPNGLALKMDGAEACVRCPTQSAGDWCSGVGGRGGCGAVCAVRRDEAAASADLGGSSKYSREPLKTEARNGSTVKAICRG